MVCLQTWPNRKNFSKVSGDFYWNGGRRTRVESSLLTVTTQFKSAATATEGTSALNC